jgi:Fe-S-cluster-containing dehydrogenase component
MEKCNFCLQRIKQAEDQAKSENRLLADGEVQTACAQVCPTNAIVFGRLDDPDSRVSTLARDGRAVLLLGELGTLPGVTYLKGA